MNRFEENEIPYETMEQFGLTREMIEDQPIHMNDDIMRGDVSPVLPLTVSDDKGQTALVRRRFAFARLKNGSVDVVFYPVLKS